MTKEKEPITDQEALAYHAEGKPGKVSILPTKPLMTQRDLSLGYSPGVAVPCLEIQKDPSKAYDYTAKGNFVAVISNGTAVLGLGNLGALAGKPVMEGKAILFKRFADIDAIDIEVDTRDVDEFVNAVKFLGPSWGGINLEDIAAPECFIIEQRLREAMDIPVFHDDQHGTAIITAAALINAAHLTGRSFRDIKVVVLGAGSAGIACLELIKRMGIRHENALLVDKTGVIYEGRAEGMNQWKSAHAVKTKKRTLAEAMDGADMFMGLAAKGAVTKAMVKSMAKNPIIFAMANPDPEITPEDVRSVRSDAIIATGRSDYPNQVNNVMGFPYIFRGALDVRASSINEEMKVAAAEAIARLAREEVPEEVSAAYSGRKMEYGAEYIIPSPFDPRLMTTVPVAVAQAAMKTGVARKPITDIAAYKKELAARRDPTANSMQHIYDKVQSAPQRMIFAEGEEEKIIRAAVHWRDNGFGQPILVGRVERIQDLMKKMAVADYQNIEIANAAVSGHVDKYIDYLYPRLQRHGYLYRDVARMVKNDRNIFASCMLQAGHGDAMVTGITRNYTVSLENITRVIDPLEGEFLFGITVIVAKGRTLFFADTTVQELPEPEQLAHIAVKTAQAARRMGHEPRVALLSYSTFGNPMRERSSRIRDAVKVLDTMKVDFEYDGEMSAGVALNREMMSLYPFCRLSAPANVLVMPALHTANIAAHLLQEMGNGVTIGPVTMGLSRPAQIAQMNATVSEIMNLAAIAAMHAINQQSKAAKLPGKGKKAK
ncbi:MAG: NADP-dependent malic enzyme [Pseudomonadota bacterium]|nr:NADP-dependent malic enzyme [Pseudomonadota bacterium]MDE3037701.1 NADP-dependent malic enzyme [Pseudomonadota bacterium]